MQILGREFRLTRRTKSLLVFACFIFGIVLFFPIENLESRLNESISRATRMDVRISHPRLGLGLRTGLVSGGLFGIKADRLEITSIRSAQTFTCEHPVVSPKILALLLLRAQIAVRCDLGASAAPIGIVVRAPLYDLNSTSAEVSLDEVPAAEIGQIASVKGLGGLLSGTIRATSFLGEGAATEVSWDVSAQDLQTPAIVSDFAQLPPLSFESMETLGSFAASRLKVDRLVLGSPNKGSFYADLKIDFGLNPMGLPVSGVLSGKQKSDPAFERAELSSINLDLLFGKPKPSGLREFRKEVQGSPMSLLMPAQE
jgi:hypothetical protein